MSITIKLALPVAAFLAMLSSSFSADAPAPSAPAPKLRLEAANYRVSRVKSQSANGRKATMEIDVGYNIRITNDSPVKAEGLVVEYQLFQNKPKGGAGFNRTRKTETLKPLGLRETAEVKTVSLTMTEVKQPNGSVKEPTNDLEGIWVRVLKGDEVLAEFVTNDQIKAAGWGNSPQRRGGRG